MATEKTFFSYSRDDSEFVVKLAKDLRTAGADVWLDQLDIGAGKRWDDEIQRVLANAQSLIVILSPSSVDSQNVMDEVSYALEKKKHVIPILLKDCVIPFRLQRLQSIDYTGDYEQALKKLVNALNLEKTEKPENVAGNSEDKDVIKPDEEKASIQTEKSLVVKKKYLIWAVPLLVIVIVISVIFIVNNYETQINKLEVKVIDLETEVAQKRAELEQLLQHRASQKDSQKVVESLEGARQVVQLSVRKLETTNDLENQLMETYPQIKTSMRRIQIPVEGLPNVSIDYWAVPYRFAETFLIEHQNSESYKWQRDKLKEVDTMQDQIFDLEKQIVVLEEEKSSAYKEGYDSAYVKYEAINEKYLMLLNRNN